MRILGIDFGARRIGLAISDATCTLARPLTTLVAANEREAIEQVIDAIARLSAEDDGLSSIVVGVPARLDGSRTDATERAATFVARLKERVALPITTEDERLSSREAESRLAFTERDWRKRKKKLDAAAAAVILQDHLDRRKTQAGGESMDPLDPQRER